MDDSFDKICKNILEVAPSLHSAGTFPARAFEAIVRAACKLEIRHSVETGSGASTLLLSHLSGNHTVFALDNGSGSVTNIRRSPLLRQDRVTFVEGSTQVTLPRHSFREKLQLVLMDGPHAYPFPDLEYYYLSPHLESGALLILDDIHIPTVHNLFQFLRRDAMFDLNDVVQSTAFFTRTSAPAFDPLGDGWERQAYNARPLRRYMWREEMKRLLSPSMQRSVEHFKRKVSAGTASVEILAPSRGSIVNNAGLVEGSATVPPDSYLWVLARRKDFDGWWPQGAGAVTIEGNRWNVWVKYGEPQDRGSEFELAALIVRQPSMSYGLIGSREGRKQARTRRFDCLLQDSCSEKFFGL